ncbi:MAG: nucleotide exchange factor GrpE [Candidatus Tagabacteria bacterium CG09_land_8_20_14_0_10_41_14]|uniref:Protein GrpE n=2 Tax=Candidatus Tagaibacteriota TaxID=1817918 RepID=A0A2H0WLB7_9BACT|nr:MAG: nucleotide exchange factor GrpE [Candidatus Tagabacteria bacterium CG09_land_8_20_14_0_10_41_14]PJE72952.1 MAG: nucleotide exchange factor GrpE [Candidatus Tagabacteria bacterium CG10_big_fil_rev_8_21_14_0_10_40_13]
MPSDITIEDENQEADSSAEEAKNKLKKIKEKLKRCQKEKEEYLSGWQRCRADFINARKDEEKKREEFIKFSNQIILLNLLPVLDSFDSALKHTEHKEKRGFVLIKTQLDEILKKHGLEPIKSEGENFNPQFHEAAEEVESEKESGIIVEEIQKGYLLHEKVLRPSKVKIAK